MKRMLTCAMLFAAFAGCHNAVGTAQGFKDQVLREAQEKFTFRGKPIPPFFLTDFCGGPDANDFWTCGAGDRITAVSVSGLFGPMESYYGTKTYEYDGFVGFFFPVDDGPQEMRFAYRFLGTTPSGITVLESFGCTGGSGRILGVVFVRFEIETIGFAKGQESRRLIMRCLGQEVWGDRVYREVKLDGNKLRLGPTHGPLGSPPVFEGDVDPARTILLE